MIKENVFLSRRAQMVPGYGFVGKDERIPRTGKIMETRALAILVNVGALRSANPIDSDVAASGEPSVFVVSAQSPVDHGTVIVPAGLSKLNVAPLPAGTKLDQHVLPVAIPSLAPVAPVVVEVVSAVEPVEPVTEVEPVVEDPVETGFSSRPRKGK